MGDSGPRTKKLPLHGRFGARERFLAGDTAGVIAELEERLAADGDDAAAWLRLGLSYVHIGHLREAEHALGRAVELDGDVVEARLAYGQVLSRLGQHDKAAFQLLQARRLRPDDVRVLRQLGATFYDKGLYSKAIEHLERAAEIAPGDARLAYAIGLCHEAGGDVARAVASLRRATELDPGLIDAWCTLADALSAIGELAEAVARLEEAQRLRRTSTRIAQNLEALRKALRDLEGQRLLGKTEAEVERSTVVRRAGLKRSGTVRESDSARASGTARGEWHEVRYGAEGGEGVELWLAVEGGRVTRATLVLLDPARAAATRDELFGVSVVSEEGRETPADGATAVTLTFLREWLGCPLTRASKLYAELLASEGHRVTFGDATLGFATVDIAGGQRHGIYVAERAGA